VQGDGGSTRSWNARPRRATAHPTDYLVVGLTCDQPMQASARFVLSELDEVVLGRGGDRGARRTGRRLAVQVADPWMSSSHARLVRSEDRWLLEDGGSKNGSRVNGWPARQATLADGDLIELGCTFFVFRRKVPVVGECADLDLSASRSQLADLVTCSPALERQFEALARIARTDAAVLVTGETGTGKELVARAVHATSGLRGPFVAVNCGAIPEGLVESQLFGHRKGAFSGATADQLGLVRSADGGTLFLDEIGDLPLPAQAAILRVLQEGEVLPVGGTRPAQVAVRVVAATHRDVDAMTASGAFREDLLGRLAGFRATLPPLRERREDLGILLAALLRKHAGADVEKVSFTPETARELYRHRWPLNVRELDNCIQRAVALCEGGRITLADLPFKAVPPAPSGPASIALPPGGLDLEALLLATERGLIEAALARTGGHLTNAAPLLGMTFRQLRYRVRKLGIRG